MEVRRSKALAKACLHYILLGMNSLENPHSKINSLSSPFFNYNISTSTKPDSLIFKSFINSHNLILYSLFLKRHSILFKAMVNVFIEEFRIKLSLPSIKDWILKVILIITNTCTTTINDNDSKSLICVLVLRMR